MHLTKYNILAALAGILLVGVLVVSVKGNVFKGSFDLKDVMNDVHVTAFALKEPDFNVLNLVKEKIAIHYTLDKNATDVLLSVSGKENKKIKVFALDSNDTSKGSHAIPLRTVDVPKDFFVVGQSYDIRIIVYNNKQEISDFKNLTVTLAPVPKPSIETTVTPGGVITSTTSGTPGTKGVHKTTTTAPIRPTWVAPTYNATIDIASVKDQGRIILTWKDESNKIAGARQSDASGNYMMNYRWKLMEGNISNIDAIEKAVAIPGASAQWESGFPVYDAGYDTQSSSDICIVPMKSDGKTTFTPRWTCTQAIIDYDALKDLAAGQYTLALQAGDGVSGSGWSLLRINLTNTEAEKKAYEDTQAFLENEKIMLQLKHAQDEKNELIALKDALDLTPKGIYLTEKDIKKITENGKEFIVVRYNVKLIGDNVFSQRPMTVKMSVVGKANTATSALVVVQGKALTQFTGISFKGEPDGSIYLELKLPNDDKYWTSKLIQYGPAGNNIPSYTAEFIFTYTDAEKVVHEVAKIPRSFLMPVGLIVN